MADKIKLSEILVQCSATLCICFLAFQTGIVNAWPSHTTTLFKSNATVLSAPMTSLHISLLGSMSSVGGLLICPFCSYAFNKFGRKYATMLFGLPFVIAWTLISMTDNIAIVLLAMTIAGIGMAGQSVSLIYISEIAHDAIRGGLTAASTSGLFLGVLISYVLGGYLTYIQVVYTQLTLSTLAVVLLMPLKESPVFLVMVGKEEEAAKSIAFYRRIDINSKEMEVELSKIRLQVDPKLEKMLAAESEAASTELLEGTKIQPTEVHQVSTEPSWKFFLKSKSSQRALVSVLTIMSMTIMMGCIVLQVYAEPLFIEAVPSMPSNQCAIFLAIDFLLASIVCVLVIDKFGRKMLFILTAIPSGICTLLLGTQLQFHWAPHWFTVLLIYMYSFVFTTGAATIPYVLAAEVFLPEVRSFCNSIVMVFAWSFNFLTLVIFNPLVEWVGLGPVFYLFSIVCFTGALYSKLYVPETKGLSVTEIQKSFLKRK